MISCLCVTYGRSKYLRRALECFKSQTLSDTELVIVTDADDHDTVVEVEALNSSKVRVSLVNNMSKIPLGELRNIAINMAQGDFVCNWDDDDWSNVDRLEILKKAIDRSKKPCVLQSRIILYDETRDISYLSYRRMWENTLLVNRDFLLANKVFYPPLEKNEDYVFVSRLVELNSVFAIDDASLYVYRFSGNNTCNKEHFDRIFQYSTELTAYHNSVIKKAFDLGCDVESVSKKVYSKYFLEQLPYLPCLDIGR